MNENNTLSQYMNENNTLSHYGVLGMKWGVRRYQKKDGSLTMKGKRKYKQGKLDASKVVGGNVTPHNKDALKKNAQKSQKAYDRVTQQKWHVAWNEAADRFEKSGKLEAINKRYPSKKLADGTYEVSDKYMQAYNEAWGKCYTDTYLEIFGDRPIK